jgi:hypothetical protein
MMQFFAVGIFITAVFFLYWVAHKFLRLCQPLPRPGDGGVIEIPGRRFYERLADRHHDMMPLLIPDHREPFDASEMFGVELDFLPDRGGFPAVNIGHVEQYAQFSALPGQPFKLRHELLVIRLG